MIARAFLCGSVEDTSPAGKARLLPCRRYDYRILKAADLIESPAYILLQAADRFQHPTRGRNELWQTDFTYLPVVGWGWYDLSTVLDDYSRKIGAWKRSDTMRVEDVTETLDLARAATGVDRVRVEPKPRLLSDNGPCYVAVDCASPPTSPLPRDERRSLGGRSARCTAPSRA